MISVIIPTYCRYDMLREAIQSVKKQQYQDVEIIVVDDCSDDHTHQIACDFPDTIYFRNTKNQGPGYCRKIGLNMSTGEYIVFLDDDDYYTDCRFFQKTVEIMEANPDYNFVAANACAYHEDTGETDGEKLDTVGEINAAEYLEGIPFEKRKPLSTFTTVFRKSSLLEAQVGRMEMVNDMPIYMRSLTVGGKVFFLEQEIGVYRIHGNNISKKMTPEFIIANLKEKADILLRIKKMRLFERYDIWWLKQVRVTLDYLLFDSQPTFCEYWTVRRWCIRNSENKKDIRKLTRKYTDIMIDRNVCAIKRLIKKLCGVD